MKKKDKVAAMQFLQTSVSELIDHSDVEQTREVSVFNVLKINCLKAYSIITAQDYFYVNF